MFTPTERERERMFPPPARREWKPVSQILLCRFSISCASRKCIYMQNHSPFSPLHSVHNIFPIPKDVRVSKNTQNIIIILLCFPTMDLMGGKMTACNKELILLGDLCLVHQTHWPNYMSSNAQIYQFILICFHMRHSALSKQEKKHRLLLEILQVMHVLVPVLHCIQKNLPDISYPYKQCRTTIKGNENIGEVGGGVVQLHVFSDESSHKETSCTQQGNLNQ